MEITLIMQIAINSLSQAISILLIAIGFAFIYRVVHFFNFAHGIIFTTAAYLVYFFISILNTPLLISVLLAMIFAAILGCLMDIIIFRPLRKKDSSPLILLLASLGIYVVIQNIISLTFGDDIKTIRIFPIKEGLNMFDARITPVQLLIICAGILTVIAVNIFLKKSQTGKAMRAVASDPSLAEVSGIDSERVILWTFGLGSLLAGIAGIFVAFDIDLTPTMGLNALMLGVVAVIIGGIKNNTGIIVGSLFIGFSRNISSWLISSQWQDAITFAILIIFLLFRPQGFLGSKN